MIIKLKVDYCSVDYIDKDGVKHCTLFVQDGNETRKFSSNIFVPTGSVCDFKLVSLIDMRKDNDGRYKPGQNHGKCLLEFDRISSRE